MQRQAPIEQLLPPPVRARHHEYSMLFSADDDPSRPSPRLLELGLRAAARAASLSLEHLCARMKVPPYYPEIWPGEHYRLLAALAQEMNPSLIIDIGTATGLSALAFKSALAPEAKIVTFDLIPWRSFPDSCLREEDFADGSLAQGVADLRDGTTVRDLSSLLEGAQLLFIDAAKDGVGEQAFINNLRQINFQNPPVVVFDDIRLWNMLKFWRDLKAPKLDMTSFGHWSGTGLVDWVW